MLVGNNESGTTKNAGESLAISIAMRIMWQCDAGCIAQWSTSRASIEATGYRHGASARIALPQRPPWPTNSVNNP